MAGRPDAEAYCESVKFPFKTFLNNIGGLAKRHRVLAAVFAVFSLVLLGFGAFIGFAPIVVLLVPIVLIGYGMLRVMSRGRDLSHAAEARLIVVAVAVATVLTGIVIQAVPYGRDHTNPAVTGEPRWANDRTRELMVRACYSCHSNEVKYPSYARVAPLSWMVQWHIDEGRSKVNYSEFATNTRGMDDTIRVIRNGSMPPGYYTRFGFHPEAKLTDAEIQELVAGLRQTPGLNSEGDRDEGGDDDD